MKKNKCGLGHNLGEDNKCVDCGKVCDTTGAHVTRFYPNGEVISQQPKEKKECDHIVGVQGEDGGVYAWRVSGKYKLYNDYKPINCPECGEKLNLKKDE